MNDNQGLSLEHPGQEIVLTVAQAPAPTVAVPDYVNPEADLLRPADNPLGGYRAPSLSGQMLENWSSAFKLDLDRMVMDHVMGVRTGAAPEPPKQDKPAITAEMIEAGAKALFEKYQAEYATEAKSRGVVVGGRIDWDTKPDTFVPDLGITWKQFHRVKAEAVLNAASRASKHGIQHPDLELHEWTRDDAQRLWNELNDYGAPVLPFSPGDILEELQQLFGHTITIRKHPSRSAIVLKLNLSTGLPVSVMNAIVDEILEQFGIKDQVDS